MDFGLVGFDHLASANPPQNNQKWGGSAFLKQEMAINGGEEDDPFRGFKMAKTSSYGCHWAVGWGGLHLGYSSGDPEPGRCRRTDGKKWRCSREAVAEGKYCERHMNRGRHRSRKPVEGQSGHSSSTTTSNAGKAIRPQLTSLQSNNAPGQGQDSKSQNLLRQFVDYWLDAALQPDTATQLSISVPTATPESTKGKLSSSQELEMGLGVGNVANEQRQATNWVPISWESPMGGPLGEVLHSAGDCKNAKPLNLMDGWESSPTGVLHRDGASTGATPTVESSKRLEGGNRCNGFKGPGAVRNPSLPAL